MNQQPSLRERLEFNESVCGLIRLFFRQGISPAEAVENLHVLNEQFAAIGRTFNLRQFVTLAAARILQVVKAELRKSRPSLVINSASRNGYDFFLATLSFVRGDQTVTRTIGMFTKREQLTTLLENVGLTEDDLYAVTTDEGANQLRVDENIFDAIEVLKQCIEMAGDCEPGEASEGAHSLYLESRNDTNIPAEPVTLQMGSRACELLLQDIDCGGVKDDEWKATTAPVKRAITDLQRESTTLSDFYVRWMQMHQEVESLAEGSKRLKSKLLIAINARAVDFFENDFFIAALLLDPRFEWTNEDDAVFNTSLLERATAVLNRLLPDVDIRQHVENFVREISRVPIDHENFSVLDFWNEESESDLEQLAVAARVVYGVATPDKDRFFDAFALMRWFARGALTKNEYNDFLVVRYNLELLRLVNFYQ